MSDVEDAARWRWVRDFVWRGTKRGDLPEPLHSYFYREDIDRKYPEAVDFDRAIDTLKEGK